MNTLTQQAQDYNNAFKKYPHSMERYCHVVDGHLEGEMTNACHKKAPCGCRSVGNGTLPFPFTVKFCHIHYRLRHLSLGDMAAIHNILSQYKRILGVIRDDGQGPKAGTPIRSRQKGKKKA